VVNNFEILEDYEISYREIKHFFVLLSNSETEEIKDADFQLIDVLLIISSLIS
jgi:hypothetical protein